jgi:phenylalanyl-tRNA synthetase beta chain
MKISLNWLNTYIPIDIPAADLADRLTMTGLEVEALYDRFAYLDRIVVARVTDIQPYPKADKLKLCRVDTGNETASIVCGAPNVAVGGKYPCALPGAQLPGGLIVEKTRIRDADSEGMLCSEGELELGPDFSGLMALDGGLAEGTPLNRALNLSDHVFEIGLTPNRPDCLSFIGIAREAAALTGNPLTPPAVEPAENPGRISELTAVTIVNPDLCPRYAARLVTGITVGPSPFWLQDRLRAIGLKPINNIVDITNFVMMETGQPLHAFDFDRLAGHRIVVQTAGAGEPFTTLDGKSHKLTDDTLMICDAEKPVAVAGVMGGENSEISDTTSRVLIESAYFDPVSIRKTAKRLGANTDASHRFERGVDPEGTLYALERAAALMAEISGGSRITGLIDEHPRPFASRSITLNTERANRHLGTSLSQADMRGFLESVGFSTAASDEANLTVRAPSFRVDVSRPEDLMEEIARLWGYNNIVTTFPKTSTKSRLPERALWLKETIKDEMTGLGFKEAINYSFTAKASCDRLALPEDDRRRRMLSILNPLSEEQAVMRTSLVPGMLEAMGKNIAYQVRDLKLFELGKIYLSNGQDQLPDEVETLGAIWTGRRAPATWQVKPEPCDFFDLKGVVESLLAGLYLEDCRFLPLPEAKCAYMRPGYSARIQINGTAVGTIGEIHPAVLKTYDLKQTAFIFEINLDRMLPLVPEVTAFSPLPKFPAASRDITLIVDNSVQAGDIVNDIYALDEPLLENVLIFDLYSGDPIPAGKKSISIRLTYRSAAETLADQTVNRIHEYITEHLIKTFNASLPA